MPVKTSTIQAEPDIQQQLMTLKAMTKTTLVLHEAQILQLKTWGQIALGFLKSLQFKIDPEDQFVEYFGKAPKKMPAHGQRFRMLEANVRWLLGDSWELRVKSGSKVIFRSTAFVAEDDDERSSKRERDQARDRDQRAPKAGA